MRRLKIFAATTAVVMGPSLFHPPLAGADDEPPPLLFETVEEEVAALGDALEERVTIWRRPDGGVIHVSHCRFAPRGCRARIDQLARWMVDVGRAHRVDPWLIAAVAFRESGLNPWAVGRAGERGIIQLHPLGREGSRSRFVRDERYRERCRNSDGACQREVLDAGARVLAQSLRVCGGDVARALSGYNAGSCEGAPEYARRILRERALLVAFAVRRRAAARALN
jgi:hypothetical protein